MKRVILTLMSGSFESGFPVLLRIQDDRQPDRGTIQAEGKLPPDFEVLNSFQAWEEVYCQLTGCCRLTPITETDLPSNISIADLAESFTNHFQAWLKSGDWEWQKIRECLLEHLQVDEEILVVVETQDPQLRRLPWHLWDLFSETYPHAEVALSTIDYKPLSVPPLQRKPRLLAIFGNSEGIDLETDRLALERLQNVDVIPSIEPPLQKLMEQLWDRSWDILYFAGHSLSQLDGNGGFLWIRDSKVPIAQLKNGLKEALRRGLRIAIFNSCDGLGLARELADLHIPQVVVMREPIPDEAAHEFLKYFLKAFTQGKSLYLSVREARERLRGIEDRFPCASWLPVICQNPAELPFQLPEEKKETQEKVSLCQLARPMLLVAVAVAACVVGVRQLGILQPLEWQAFDRLQQLRPHEKPDPRLLVVAVTESDIQKRQEPILTDRTLSQVLSKLEQYKPQAIGLDIYRDFPVPKNDAAGHQALLPHLLSPRLIGVCAVPTPDKKGVAALPIIPRGRLGFSEVVPDDDGILRRHLLFLQPDPQSPCPITEAFSLQLSLNYLKAKGIKPQLTPQGEYRLQNTTFTPLSDRRGSYRTTDLRGYQILLNYRMPQSLQNIAPQVTLSQVLNNQLDPQLVKGKIVLIGMTAESVPDRHLTPYGSHQQKIPGVLLQAQMTSQILSAVLDGRPLLWVWPDWAEGLWIVGWSLVGGVLAIVVGSRLLVLAIGGAVVVLIAICWGSLLFGGCFPLVPSALVLLITASSVWASYIRFKTSKMNRYFNSESQLR
jgi:CHASE2 domain-containing sensor protein